MCHSPHPRLATSLRKNTLILNKVQRFQGEAAALLTLWAVSLALGADGQQHPGPLTSRATVMTTKMFSRRCQIYPGEQSHPWLETTLFPGGLWLALHPQKAFLSPYFLHSARPDRLQLLKLTLSGSRTPLTAPPRPPLSSDSPPLGRAYRNPCFTLSTPTLPS